MSNIMSRRICYICVCALYTSPRVCTLVLFIVLSILCCEIPSECHMLLHYPFTPVCYRYSCMQVVFYVCIYYMMFILVMCVYLAEKTHHLFSEIALNSLLQLLKKQVAENSRHLNQYFQVFLNYANRGVTEVRG